MSIKPIKSSLGLYEVPGHRRAIHEVRRFAIERIRRRQDYVFAMTVMRVSLGLVIVLPMHEGGPLHAQVDI